MQANDKNNSPLDDQFFDQAWENMRSTLDKEMPTKKKRRRFLPWFFLMTGAVIGLLFWYGISFSTQDVVTTPIVENPMSSPIQNNTNTNTKKVFAPSNANPISPNNTISKSTLTKQVKKSNFTQPAKNNKSFTSNTTPTTQQDIYRTNKTTKPKDQFISDIPVAVSNNKTITSLALLNSINPLLENKTTQLEFDLKSKETVKLCPPKRKIEFGIQGGLTNNFSPFNKIGFTAGGFIHFPIGKKWGIQTGLNYTTLAQNQLFYASENHDVILEDNSQSGGITPVANLDLYQLNTTIDYQLKSIHYLEIPLTTTFQISSKWKLQAGANFSKAIRGSVSSSEEQNFFLIDNDPTSALELNNVRTNNIGFPELSNQEWKKNFVSALLGISWNPVKQLSFNLSYHQAILDNDFKSLILQDQFNYPANASGAFADMNDDLNSMYNSLRFTLSYKF